VEIHLADHLLKTVAWEHVAQDVEDLAGALRVEVVFNLADAVEEFFHHAAFTGVGGDEVENQAVLSLAIAVDATHPLLETHGVPRDVVVDHQPAELKVDALAGGLGGDHDLRSAVVAEDSLGVEPRARRVAVAYLHATVNLRDAQAPIGELADEVVECVFVLGKHQELHGWVFEDALFGDDLA